MNTARLIVGWVLVVLAACQPAGTPNHGDMARSVLILGSMKYPVMSLAIETVHRRNERLSGAASNLSTDFRSVESGADIEPVLQQVLQQPSRYAAIYTNSQMYARAAQLRAPEQPIVFDGVDDPVANCLVDSLAHPGRNATGYMHLLPDNEAKMLEVLHDGFAELRSIIVLASGHEYTSRVCNAQERAPATEEGPPCAAGMRSADTYVKHLLDADRVESAAHRLGLPVHYLVLCGPQDFELARRAAQDEPAAGFVVPWHSLFAENIDALTSTLASTRRPAAYPSRAFTDAGGVVSVEPILERGEHRASVLILMQVLDGRNPADLPVQSPRGFEIRFNAAAAARLGLHPSKMLLHRADQIVF